MSKHPMNNPINKLLTNKASVSDTSGDLRTEVHELADDAFHRHLISGHGDGEYPDEYQIVQEGKPRHLPLSRARAFLARLIHREKTVRD